MSAFVVHKEAIDRTVHAARLFLRKHYLDPFNMKAIDDSIYHEDWETELGKDLLSMNYEAVNQRYPDDQEDGANCINEYVFTPRYDDSIFQMYKSVQCLLYQCSEGNVPETDLFKKLDRFEKIIAKKIVSSLPEYEAAKWG